MGNRAVITTRRDFENNGIGVYLHWNGTINEVSAFLTYCAMRGFRSVDLDSSYAYARLVQVIANTIGGGLSVGVGLLKDLDCDNYDNGTYIIEGWEIVDRMYSHEEDAVDENVVEDLLRIIDKAQPEDDRIFKEE